MSCQGVSERYCNFLGAEYTQSWLVCPFIRKRSSNGKKQYKSSKEHHKLCEQFGLVQDGIFHQTKRLVNIDRDVLWRTLSGWNFFHESVKKFNEVMCVTNDNWTPIPMYCSNCGELLYGYRNDEGKIKYECKRCGTVTVRVQKRCRHNKIDLYAPEGLNRGWTMLHKKRAATHICECSSSAGSPRAFLSGRLLGAYIFYIVFQI